MVGGGTFHLTKRPATQAVRRSVAGGFARASAYNWYTDMRNRVNRERTQYNLVLLTLNSQLNTAAGRHATAMASKNFFSHNDPYDGSTPTTRIRAAGYMTGWSTWTIAENIHAGTDCWYPHYAMDAWMRSATHRANILNPAFRHLGAGRAYNAASTYKYYWCQTFGNRY
jgi:uncharacterized protein YkwD